MELWLQRIADGVALDPNTIFLSDDLLDQVPLLEAEEPCTREEFVACTHRLFLAVVLVQRVAAPGSVAPHASGRRCCVAGRSDFREPCAPARRRRVHHLPREEPEETCDPAESPCV